MNDLWEQAFQLLYQNSGQTSTLTYNVGKNEVYNEHISQGSGFSCFGVIDNAVSCMRRGYEASKELNKRVDL